MAAEQDHVGRRRTAPTRAPSPRRPRAAGAGGSDRATVRCGWNLRTSGRNASASPVSRSATSPVSTRLRRRRSPPRGPGPAASTGTPRGRAPPAWPTGARGDRCHGLLEPRRQASCRASEELQRHVPVLRGDPPCGRERAHATARSAAVTTSTAASGTSTARNSRCAGSAVDSTRRRPSSSEVRAGQRHALEVPADEVEPRLLRPAAYAERVPPARGTRARAAHRRHRARSTPFPVRRRRAARVRPLPSSARPMSAPNTRRAPAAISRAQASLTTPGPSIVSCETPRTRASPRPCRRPPNRRSSPTRRGRTSAGCATPPPVSDSAHASDRPGRAEQPPDRLLELLVVDGEDASPSRSAHLGDQRGEQRLGFLARCRLGGEADLDLARRTPGTRRSDWTRPRTGRAASPPPATRRGWPIGASATRSSRVRRATRAPAGSSPPSSPPSRLERRAPRRSACRRAARRPDRARCRGTGVIVRKPSGTSACRRLLSGMSPRPYPANFSRSSVFDLGVTHHRRDRAAPRWRRA